MERMEKQLPEIQKQLDRVEKRLEQPVPPEFREQMERMEKHVPEIQKQLDRVEERLANPVPSDLREQMERMGKEVMELSASITVSSAALEKRLEQLEARLDTMKTDAKEDLDRAAAAAAARILREELTAILTEEAK